MVIFLFSCNSYNEDAFFRRIYSSAKNNEIIALENFTDFEWNNVIICNPGTSQKDYEKLIGPFDFKNYDMNKVIIFRIDDTVVKTMFRNYHPDERLSVEFYIDTNFCRIIKKEEAIFKVEVIKNYIDLHPAAEIVEKEI